LPHHPQRVERMTAREDNPSNPHPVQRIPRAAIESLEG
jgi:hypothetical protein